MTEERLKEIKDSISYAHRISCDPAISMDFRDKEDLYYEVIRLKGFIENDKKIEKIDFKTLNTQKEKNKVMKNTINMLIDKINELENK